MGFLTPKTVRGVCTHQYMKNEAQVRFELNAIPFNANGTNSWTVYFPRPFQILGLCLSPQPNLPAIGSPAWPMVKMVPDIPINQGAYSQMSPALMLELAIATMRPYDGSGAAFTSYPVEYVDPFIQDVNYRGYFTKYLNDEITDLARQQNLNNFLAPSNLWDYFATINNGATNIEWFNRFQQFVKTIQDNSDMRLYGSPGLYTVHNVNSYYEWTAPTEYLTLVDA